MKVHGRFVLDGEELMVVNRLREFLSELGYVERAVEDGRLEFERPAAPLGFLGYKIEELHTRLAVRHAPSRGDSRGEGTVVTLDYEVAKRFRLVTRLDSLYFELEMDDLRLFVERGIRRIPASRIRDVRTPVAMAAMSNTLLSAALVAAACVLIGFGFWTMVLVGIGVAMINLVSIVGFADLIVDGMTRLRSGDST